MSRWDDELAWFVVAVGMQPSEVWDLTVGQANAIKTMHRRANQ